MDVRKAEQDDAAGLAELARGLGLFAWMEGRDAAALRQRVGDHLALCLRDESHTVLVAEEAGTLLGFLSLHWLPYLVLEGPEGHISELFVRAESRGQGVGVALLHAARREATQRGCSRLSLLNRRTRESYQRGFYAKQGFEERGDMANFVAML